MWQIHPISSPAPQHIITPPRQTARKAVSLTKSTLIGWILIMIVESQSAITLSK